MKYEHILAYVAVTPWAIAHDKWNELLSVLAFRVGGGSFTPEEIHARIGGDREPAAPTPTPGGVAVLPIRGVIAHRMNAMEDSSGGTSSERIGAMLRSVMGDESISTIVLDIDSPGGTVTGVSELSAQIRAARETKRITAVANGMAASAAYWLASQADEIVSIPSGVVGSIGVFSAHTDLSKALAKQGVDVTLMSAGKYKVEGNPFEPLSDEARAVMQARVDDAYAQFVADVAEGRGVDQADVRGGYGHGRALTAKDALAAGMIDRIDTMDGVLSGLMGPRSSRGMRAETLDPDADLRRRLERF